VLLQKLEKGKKQLATRINVLAFGFWAKRDLSATEKNRRHTMRPAFCISRATLFYGSTIGNIHVGLGRFIWNHWRMKKQKSLLVRNAEKRRKAVIASPQSTPPTRDGCAVTEMDQMEAHGGTATVRKLYSKTAGKTFDLPKRGKIKRRGQSIAALGRSGLFRNVVQQKILLPL